ncbi:MAG: hypothetical protein KGI08_02760 [Thaumarchaeota archaeon]|nr:hypothetical protein [Nitrososphaerota archaeon]
MTENDAPEKLVINGQEIDPEEATQLIDLGNKYRKLESDLNTSLDKVYPKYTQLSQEKQAWETEKQRMQAELEEYKKPKQEIKETPDEVTKAREAARQLGLADESYLKEKGYMTRGEVEALLQQTDQVKRSSEELTSTGERLAKEIDGSDGRTPYNSKAVLAYASTYGFFNKEKSYEESLKEAYNDMNPNTAWKEAQIEAKERAGLTTLKPGGKKTPEKPKMTPEAFHNQLGEFVEEWTKNNQ